MNLKPFWKSLPAIAAVCFLMFVTPALPQPVKGGPNVVVYESPT